jgi:uncharacterized protein (TIGR02996 family)
VTSDHDALLRAICEHPREDTPRLAFADWLEENGQADRAAFIRTDIAMALRDEWDSERLRWENKNGALSGPGYKWAGSLPLPDQDSSRLTWCGKPFFRRGFPWAVRLNDLGVFNTRAADLFSRHPLEHLEFQRHLPQLNRLVAEAWFPRVQSLEWSEGRYSEQTLLPLLKAANAGVLGLTIKSLAITPNGLEAVLRSRLFRSFTQLSLTGTGQQVVGATLQSLWHIEASDKLRRLTIRGDSLNRNIQTLACRLPPSLRLLDIMGTHINSAGAREFAGVKAISCLRMLTISNNPLGNEGGTALFTSPHLASLKVLDMRYCQVGDDALRVLLENSPLVDGLNFLNLAGSPASGEMKEAVKARMGERVSIS